MLQQLIECSCKVAAVVHSKWAMRCIGKCINRNEVATTHFYWVNTCFIGDEIDEALDGVRRFWATSTTVCSNWCGVGNNISPRNSNSRNAIATSSHCSGENRKTHAGAVGVGTLILSHRQLQGQNATIIVECNTCIVLLSTAMQHCNQTLTTCLRVLHWPANFFRQQCR